MDNRGTGMSQFGAFLVVAIVLIVTPGPDTALTIRNTLGGGRRGGVATAFGVVSGQLAWTLAACAGLAAVLAASSRAFLTLKIVGAAYLVYLGALALYRACRPATEAPVESTVGRRRPALGAAFRQGLISNLSNPKIAVFFTTLLPQFTPSRDASFLGLLLLGLVFATLTLAWLTAYAFAVARAGDFFARTRIRRGLEAFMGATLVDLGFRLATARE